MEQDQLTPEEEQQIQEEPQHVGPRFDYSPVGEMPTRRAAATAQRAKQAGSFVAKNKKWFIGGTVSVALLGSIALFFFWLMLFKNVHIKNLYVTYRWAQFNRGLNMTLKNEIAVDKIFDEGAKGNVDTVLSESASPQENIKKLNGDRVDLEKVDLSKETPRVAETLKSVDLDVTEAVFEKFDTGRAVPEASGENASKEIGKKMAQEIAEPGEALRGSSENLGSAVDEATELEKSGKSARSAALEAADNFIKGGSSGAAQAIRAATGSLVVVSFYCIFRDIYVSAKDQLNKVALGGAIAAAQEVNKTADCQQLGECTLDQAGAMSEKFDNGEESFTDSCGYTRATQTDNPDCKEINPQYTVNSFSKMASQIVPGGGTAVKTADYIFDPPDVGPVKTSSIINTGCRQIMSTPGQLIIAALNGVGIYMTGGGWEAVGQGVWSGVKYAAATAGGKALIAHAIMMYSGNLYDDLNPYDMGNLTDMGNKATASASCKAAGCVKATPEQARKLNEEYRTERIAQNKKRSTIAKLFDTKSSDSVLVRTALNTPTNPSAITARIASVFASISNPIKLNLATGKLAITMTSDSANAASIDDNPYGIADYVPANVLHNYNAVDVDAFYDNLNDTQKSSLEDKYQKCNNDSDSKSLAESLATQDVGDCTGEDYTKYAAAKFNRKVIYAWGLSYNNQSGFKGSVGGAVGGTTEATSATKGTDTSNMKCPAGTADKGVFKTFNGVSIRICNVGGRTEVNASAAQAFYSMRVDAAKAGVTLDGGGFRSYEEQVALRKAHCADWQNTPSRNCRPPTAKPGSSMHEEGLAIDYEMTNGVFAWLKANASKYGIKNLPAERWHWSTTGN